MFNSIFNLADLDGSNGFAINGINIGDLAGFAVSNAGDVNNDGIADIIIGAPSSLPGGRTGAGESYVVFGGANVGSSGNFNLADLDGSNGFVINQANAGDFNEVSVNNAGDINNDGIDDLVIGASNADPNGNSNGGESYVIFGGANVGSSGSLNLSTLNGNNGFTINGDDSGDFSGRSVSNAGDINNDGIADLIIGAPAADPNGGNSGESYVIFGGSNIGNTGDFELDSLNGINGFVINGIDAADFQGFSVSNAGDINNDGVDDLIVAASLGDPAGIDGAGESYVVFGGSNVGSSGSIELSTLDGTNGFVLNGIDAADFSGRSVSNAGDINNDGIADLVIGAPNADTNGNNSGESYVIFGASGIGNTGSFDLSTLDGTNGFVINGIDNIDFAGRSVSNAGDINSDGIDDLIIGAARAESNTNNNAGAGDSYVIFGNSNIGNTGTLELGSLDGTNGFLINGVDLTNSTGFSVSNVGDINGDGADDLIIGAFEAEANGNSAAGQSYIVFGIPPQSTTPTSGDDNLIGLATSGDDTIDALAGNDTLAGLAGDDSLIGRAGDDTIDGGTGNDTLLGNAGNDTLNGGADNDSLQAGPGEDILNGDSGNDFLNGGNDNDVLNGGSGDDELIGGSGNDLLNGDAGNDNLNGQDGNDILNGQDGDDFLAGLAGNDTINGGSGNDTLVGGNTDLGADLLNGGAGMDRIFGQGGDDTIDGGNDADTLGGGDGNDILTGGDDGDRLFGNEGNDELFGELGDDFLNSGEGDDTLMGGDGNDTMTGASGNDLLNGDEMSDRLFGGSGNDTLSGDEGDDLINGQEGDDIINGGSGRDTLFGGSGADQFAITSGITAERDLIQDYEDGVDTFDLIGGLTFGDLTLVQSGNTALIRETSTNQTLAAVSNTNIADLDATDFV